MAKAATKTRSKFTIVTLYSGQIAPTRTPSDILELGKAIIQEIGLDDENDTLGRWMCHHIASLISEAENSATDSSRVLARKEAQSAILSLWEKRAALPGCAYPLARYKYLLRCLSAMSPDASIWEGHGSSSLDDLARNIFTNLTGITNIVLGLKSRPPLFERKRQPVPSISVEFLDMLEKKLLSAAETLDDDTLSLLAKLGSDPKEVRDPRMSSLTNLLKVVEAAQSNLTKLTVEINRELSLATKEQPQPAEPDSGQWQVTIVTELSQSALKECAEILRMGGAVNVSSARNGLLRASKVALAMSGGRTIGLAALKAKRPAYSARIAGLSATSIGKEAVEVGYVAVRDDFRGRGLGGDLVSKLLAGYDGALFATTSSGAMKKVLRKERFRRTGKTWQEHQGVCRSGREGNRVNVLYSTLCRKRPYAVSLGYTAT